MMVNLMRGHTIGPPKRIPSTKQILLKALSSWDRSNLDFEKLVLLKNRTNKLRNIYNHFEV